jgi:hypothetical protein
LDGCSNYVRMRIYHRHRASRESSLFVVLYGLQQGKDRCMLPILGSCYPQWMQTVGTYTLRALQQVLCALELFDFELWDVGSISVIKR